MDFDLILMYVSRIFILIVGIFILIKLRSIDSTDNNQSVIGDKIEYSRSLLELIDELITTYCTSWTLTPNSTTA